ncbi:hypothetical protein V8E53_001392 [Lactarius tabidus]
MSFPLLTFASYLILVSPLAVRAQLSAPNCTDSSLAWSYNSLQQNPCWIVAYLAAVCNGGSFIIPALLSQNSYSGPTGSDDSDMCKCNTVVYNLISACDACQGSPWVPYSLWTSNCTNKANPGTFPEPVPAGTRVPKWAYIDSSIGDSWNISQAQAVGDSPEVTGTASNIHMSTSGISHSTLTPSSSTSTSTSQHHSSDAGAIAGGVIGSLLGAGLIIGVIAWYLIRRRRARSAPSTAYLSLHGSENDHWQPLPYPPTIETPRLYDPSDPTTYPSGMYTPVSDHRLSTTSHPRSHEGGGYTGLPEI